MYDLDHVPIDLEHVSEHCASFGFGCLCKRRIDGWHHEGLHIVKRDIGAVIFDGFQGDLNIASDGVDVVSDGDFGRGESGGSEGA